MSSKSNGFRLRRPLLLVLPLLLALVAAWGFWPRALPVDLATVSRSGLSVGFTEEGRTRLPDTWVLSAPIDGSIERLELEPGDRVERGQELARLHPLDASLLDPAARAERDSARRAAVNELAAADADLSAAQSRQARLAAERERVERLAAQRLVSRSELDAIRAEAETADAAARAADARRAAVAARLEGLQQVLALEGRAAQGRAVSLASPIDGVVLRRPLQSATPVRAGQAIVELGDLGGLEVLVEALTVDAVQVHPGAAVRLLRWGGPEALAGHVRRIEPAGFTKVSALGVEEQRVAVIVAFDQPPPAGSLGEGYRLDAEFVVWSDPQALVVPNAALFRVDGGYASYVVEDGRARLRGVELGQRGTDASEVLQGLAEGEQVVLYPGERVVDGRRVERRQ